MQDYSEDINNNYYYSQNLKVGVQWKYSRMEVDLQSVFYLNQKGTSLRMEVNFYFQGTQSGTELG